jgi:hypothetical protein
MTGPKQFFGGNQWLIFRFLPLIGKQLLVAFGLGSYLAKR